MNTDSIKNRFAQVFENDYQGYEYFIENVVNLIFTGDDAYEPLPVPEEFLTDEKRQRANESGILSILKVGTVDAEEPVDLYDITLSDRKELQYNRVGIQQFIRSELFSFTNAFMLFHNETPEGKDWRFSYAYKETTQKSMTSAKRYTYLFGKNHRARTASERFAKLAGEDKNTQNLLNAFSVEALSDEFFDKYKAIYANWVQYITGKRIVKKSGKWEETLIHEPDETLYNAFDRDDKRIRDYIKKTLGRITFLYFLQRKKWLNENPKFMRKMFEGSKYQDDYLDRVLEPLFYTILNTAPENRKAAFEQHNASRNRKKEVEWDVKLLDQWKDIPFLNGGLFERDADDVVRTKFPATFFSNPINGVENYAGKEKDRIPGLDYDWEQVPGLLDFFEQYNFTIDENDPDDAEVGVDPEMLGRIFENLLEDNKDKGAFYTPKEIVQYMCNESLIDYLQTKVPSYNDEIRHFVEVADASNLTERKAILAALRDVKICDPAIGSGAFPMGLLNLLVKLRENLGDTLKRVDLKKEIISNNIYGVDIERGAVDIARLRFWLSIVVDEDNPLALPNFDYKFMQGNSLLECFDGVDLSRMLDNEGNTSSNGKKKSKAGKNQLGLEFVSADTKRNLQLKLHDYFNIANHEQKLRQRNSINESVKNYICQLGISLSAEEKLSALDPSANQEFFLWHTWFKDVFDNGGFDIVIGNPPYVSAVTMARSKSEKNIFKKLYSEATGCYDIYVLFLLLAKKISNGAFSFIIPNKFLIQDYAKQTKETLIENGLYKSVDVSIFNVFKKINVYPIIILASKKLKKCYQEYTLNKFEDLQKNLLIEHYKIPTTNTIKSLGLKVCSGATGFEAQKIKQFVRNGCEKNCIPFTVSGNVDRYVFNNTNVQYMKGKYEKAFVLLDDSIPSSKKAMWNNPKIVIAGMTKCVEATYTVNPLGLGVGIYAITDFGNLSPLYILGLLNSKYTTNFFRNNFKDKHLAGGYLAINKTTIEDLPLFPANTAQQKPIIALVEKILAAKKENPQADTSVWEEEIDRLVYKLYGLTKDEIKVVEGK